MDHQKGWLWLSLTTLAVLMGCGQSPLLHHLDASAPAHHPGPKGMQRPGSCALELPKAGLCASITWEKRPTDEEEGRFTLRFWSKTRAGAQGPYVSPVQTVGVKLMMPRMHHGSSPVQVSQSIDARGRAVPGVYLATRLFFSMPGDWEIWIQLKEGRTVIEQAIQKIKISS